MGKPHTNNSDAFISTNKVITSLYHLSIRAINVRGQSKGGLTPNKST